MIVIFRKIFYVLRTEGIFALFVHARRRLSYGRINTPITKITRALGKIDVIGFYDFVLIEDAGIQALNCKDVDRKSINWLIPDFGIGSGGHLNIFRYIFFLEKKGYKNTICLVGDHRHASTSQARALINNHFFPLQAEVVFGVVNLPPAYLSIATSWITAYALRGFSATNVKIYFVQDFEPAFYAQGSEYDFAEETYKFGFVGICAGGWLAEMLHTNYGMDCYTLGFSFDRDLYHQTPRRNPDIRRVFCYCRPPTIRRGLESALLALDIVGRQLPDVEFILAGWDMGDYYFPHTYLNAGVVSLKELPDLYSQCDAALVLSFSNLSLLPLELMACGCVVISNRGPNTEWLLNDSNSILVESAPLKIAKAIVDLLEDTQLRTELAERAKTYTKSTSWDIECDRLVDIFGEITK